jgi:hypothetical protein
MYLILEDWFVRFQEEDRVLAREKYEALKAQKDHGCKLTLVEIIDNCEIKFVKSGIND